MLEFDPEKSRTIGRTRNSVVDFGLEFLMKYKEVQVRENNDQQIQLAIPLLPHRQFYFSACLKVY